MADTYLDKRFESVNEKIDHTGDYSTTAIGILARRIKQGGGTGGGGTGGGMNYKLLTYEEYQALKEEGKIDANMMYCIINASEDDEMLPI